MDTEYDIPHDGNGIRCPFVTCAVTDHTLLFFRRLLLIYMQYKYIQHAAYTNVTTDILYAYWFLNNEGVNTSGKNMSVDAQDFLYYMKCIHWFLLKIYIYIYKHIYKQGYPPTMAGLLPYSISLSDITESLNVSKTHCDRDKLAASSQTIFLDAFYLNEHVLKILPHRPIASIPVLVQIMAWRRPRRQTNRYLKKWRLIFLINRVQYQFNNKNLSP